MIATIDWEEIPDDEFERYKKRLEIVELLLDESIDSITKKEEMIDYCRQNRVTRRTLRNYINKYRKKGPEGLLFYRKREKSPRIYDADLRSKIKQLVTEQPARSVPMIRRILDQDETYRDKISRVSDRTIYRFLEENSLSRKERSGLLIKNSRRAYHSFEAPHSMALVQGDARDGIWLNLPDGTTKKTYLFLWIDDFSRKILFGKYYLNEKLPCMEDSFKYLILRYGIPLKIYLDNGSVYISKHFASILAELLIKQLHHKPYQAYCKGKIEVINRTIKYSYQKEAELAGFRTLEELNTSFWAWAELEYNKKIHSSTGQAPDERFIKGLPENHRRIKDIEKFNAMFLWKDTRKVSKYGKIKLYSNQYPVQEVAHGNKVQVRFDPFNLEEVYIYDLKNNFLEKTQPNKTVNIRVPNIPEESKRSSAKVSQDSVNYLTRLREKYLESQKKSENMRFSKLFEEKEDNND